MTSTRYSEKWWQNVHAQNRLYLQNLYACTSRDIKGSLLCGVDPVPRSPTIASILFCLKYILHQSQLKKK